MAGEEAAIGAMGVLIFAGLLGRLFLRRTGVSDVFLLMLSAIIINIYHYLVNLAMRGK